MLTYTDLTGSQPFARLESGSPPVAHDIRVEMTWQGSVCRAQVTNLSATAARLDEIVLFSCELGMPPETVLYGEGFQVQSQYGGTLEAPADVGSYSDRNFYRIPQMPDAFTVYNLLLLAPPGAEAVLLAFTSCHRFSGEFRLREAGLEVVLDCESLLLLPGESWELEEFLFVRGSDRGELLAQLAGCIEQHHVRRAWPVVPTGWCSWYAYFADVSEEDILANLDVIAREWPELKYVQIDDGYEAFIGDWLSPGPRFPRGIPHLCEQIRRAGCTPAIWVAPFVAERNSRLFRSHPDWFLADDQGTPLSTDLVSYGGWHNGPWYALDGTHPEAQAYLEHVFRTMHDEWGCTYFKLDANMWGAMHGGQHYDRGATRVEAYRRGMAAILRGAGPDSFILGCNAPVWPSLGLVNGQRLTNDTWRSWQKIASNAREAFRRNWQNGRLWLNDPDCLVLENLNDSQVTADEFGFHAAAILASGGLVLSGDNLTALSPASQRILRRLLPAPGIAARFDDPDFHVGRILLPDCELLALFNWHDVEQDLDARLWEGSILTDFWTGEAVPHPGKAQYIPSMPPHSARVLVCSTGGQDLER
jgi:alpha-galactosidase